MYKYVYVLLFPGRAHRVFILSVRLRKPKHTRCTNVPGFRSKLVFSFSSGCLPCPIPPGPQHNQASRVELSWLLCAFHICLCLCDGPGNIGIPQARNNSTTTNHHGRSEDPRWSAEAKTENIPERRSE